MTRNAASRLLKFCYDMLTKVDNIRKFTEESYDEDESSYHYGQGFCDGLDEACSTIGQKILEYFIEKEEEEEEELSN